MPISLEQMKNEVAEHLGVDEDDLATNAVGGGQSGADSLELLINRSLWEVTDKFNFKEKEGLTSFSTVEGTAEYDLPTVVSTFEAVQVVGYTDPDTDQRVLLTEKPWHWYLQNHNTDETARGKPEYFLRKGSELWLYPTPDDIYSISLHFLQSLSDLSLTIPRSWHEIIMYGAVWRGKLRQNDSAGAMVFKRHQLSLIESAQTTAGKEDKDNRYAGVQVLGREY
jgi:acyl carrier protein